MRAEGREERAEDETEGREAEVKSIPGAAREGKEGAEARKEAEVEEGREAS